MQKSGRSPDQEYSHSRSQCFWKSQSGLCDYQNNFITGVDDMAKI